MGGYDSSILFEWEAKKNMKRVRKGKKTIIFYVPDEVHHKFKIKVARDKKDMSKVMRNLVEAYTEKRLNCKGETQ
ncbi:unnamed protein product [marine sediment metagenome]|uniref:Uncharacterized protein n=1 Tax=marine sediment metagenome TaxID=412755 RepID=X1RE21_9ZZZZ